MKHPSPVPEVFALSCELSDFPKSRARFETDFPGPRVSPRHPLQTRSPLRHGSVMALRKMLSRGKIDFASFLPSCWIRALLKNSSRLADSHGLHSEFPFVFDTGVDYTTHADSWHGRPKDAACEICGNRSVPHSFATPKRGLYRSNKNLGFDASVVDGYIEAESTNPSCGMILMRRLLRTQCHRPQPTIALRS